MTHHRLVSSTDHCKMVSCLVQSVFDNPSTPPEVDSVRMGRNYDILGSCNGLVCFYAICHGYAKLWYPSTRLRSKRSQIVASRDESVTYHGFGHDHVHDKLKLLVVVNNNFRETVIKVYTFGANSRTTIQDFSCRLTGRLGKFVSGTLNWLARVPCTTDQWEILSFDLAKETHSQVDLPDRDDGNHGIPVLGVLRNCLCACIDHKKTWVVWMMKEYGVQSSWTKLVMIPHVERRLDRLSRSLNPLYISEDVIVLVTTSFSTSFLYNSNDGRLNYSMTVSNIGFDIRIYHESLVSPPH